jgi:hypothetical protein
VIKELKPPPDPIEKVFFLKCPACGKRIWNFHGGEYLAYLGHWYGKHF